MTTNRSSACARALRAALLGSTALAVTGTVSLAMADVVLIPESGVVWKGGDGDWTVGPNWEGDAAPGTGDNVLVDGDKPVDSTVTVNTSPTIGNLTISAGDTVAIQNARTFTLGGDLFNAGLLVLNSTGSTTNLRIGNGVTFSGGGELLLSNSAGNRFFAVNGSDVLTNASDHTIRGSGQLGIGLMGLVNQGLILADQITSLTVQLNNADGVARANEGTMRASDGATLTIASTNLNNTGGLIEARDGSTVALSGSSITAGTLRTAGDGVVTLVNATLEDLTNEGLVRINNAQTGRLAGTTDNAGEIRLNSVGSLTDLVILDDVTLAGDGVLSMSDVGGNRIYGSPPSSVLTNTSDHTIRGSGQLGIGLMGLVNQGLILADQITSLTVQLNNAAGVDRDNQGTMRASDGATLTLLNTDIDNTGGLIEALDGSTVALNGSRITAGTLRTEGDGVMTLQSNATLEDLTNEGLVRINNAFTGGIEGTIDNAGEIRLNSVGSTTDLVIQGDVTLAGGGVLSMSNVAGNRIRGNAETDVLTNTFDHTIRGSGQLGVNSMGLINQGLIVADQSAGLTVQLNNAAGVDRDNQGTMRASDGATLTLLNTDIDNTGGLIEALNGSTVALNGSRITAGTLRTEGDGVMTLQSNATLEDLTNEGLVRINNAFTGGIEGTIDNAGEIRLNSVGSTTDLVIQGDVTLAGGGVLSMSNVAGNRIRGNAATDVLTNASDHTIRGSGQLGVNSMGLINQGLILADQSAGLTVQLNNADGVDRDNQGTMRASDGATLTILNTDLDNTGGLIEALNGSTVVLNGSSVTAGTLRTEGDGVVTLQSNATLEDLINEALVRINNAQTGRLAGTIDNAGEIRLNSAGSSTTLRLDGDVTLAGDGVLSMSDFSGNNIRGNAATDVLTNTSDHTIRGSGQLGVNSMGLINEGVIEGDGTVALVIDPTDALTVENRAGGMLRGSGTGGLSLTGGSFDNQGSIEALNGSNVTVSTNGTLTNLAGGVLTGGTYRAVATGDGALVSLRGADNLAIGENAAEIVLSGAGSALRSGVTTLASRVMLEDSLTLNSGALRVLGSRDFAAVSALTNTGVLELGGGRLTAPGLDNLAAAEIFGFGSITPSINNAGLVRASGGVLTAEAGISGPGGTVVSESGATLAIEAASSAEVLDLQGGSLDLGVHDFTVSGDYRNAAFGAGNAFDARANVSGAGAILAAGDVALGIGGDSVTFDGDGDRYVLNFQDIRVGSTETRSFIVRNDGTDGPALRGAVQTAVNGGNVTSPALSGPGVTAQNFGPIATGDGESFDVTYAPTEAGVLTGQQVFVDTNFDNVDGETVAFEARGILAAAGTLSATSLDFGSVRTTDPAPVQTIDVTNTTAAGPFSEALGIGIDDAGSGDFAVADTDLGAAIAAGTTASDRIQVTLDNSTAGTKTGSFEVAYSSLPVAGSNLAAASVGGDTVALSGIVTAMDVFQTAIPEFDPEPLDFGVHRVGSGDVVRTLTVTNAAVGEEGFVDRLAGTLAVAAGSTPPFSGDGDLGGGLESLESTGIDFTLATDTAGSFNGAIEAALTSENDTMDPLALDVPSLVMTGQVNNLANPGFAFGGGDGLFQGLGGGRFVLDFGTVDIADGPVSAELLVTNEFVFVGAPQDDLGGSFTVDGDTVFATLGFDAFADLAAGNSLGGFEITLDPQAAGVGTYTSFIGLLGLSTFAGLPDLSPEELELALGYLPELEVNVVVTPLPASVWFLGSALAALGAAAARRRRAQAQAEAQAQVVAA